MSRQLEKPFKMINMVVTTVDPLTAEVLKSAKLVKRQNAVLAMMLEAYLATPEGRVTAAQQLRIPVSELLERVSDDSNCVEVGRPAAAHSDNDATPVKLVKSSLKFDNLL